MDPSLEAMMHGELQPNKKKKASDESNDPKSQLEDEIDEEIDAYVDAMELEGDHTHTALQSPKMRRENIKLQIREAMKMPELTQLIDSAFEILYSEGTHFLSKEAYQTLLSDLTALNENLPHIGIKEVAIANLQTLANISDDSMNAIMGIALAKFKERQYMDCLALFSLMSTLNPEQPDFWFRLGIAAQKCDKIELASRAYAATLGLDPDNIGARLFAAECFVTQNLHDEAQSEIALAKKISKDNKVDQIWLDFLPVVEAMIKVKHV